MYDFSDKSGAKNTADLCVVPIDPPGKPKVLLHWQGSILGADWR